MGRPGVLVALALLVAGAVGACSGDSSDALSAAQPRQRTNAQCRGLDDAADEIDAAGQPSVTGEAVTRHVSKSVALLRRRYRAIDALVPPDALADDMDRFVSLFERYAKKLEAFGRQAEPGQTLAELQRTHQSEVVALNDLTQRANTIATELGFVDCNSGAA